MTDTSAKKNTAEEFLEKLRKALSSDGDFPASAKVVAELRTLTSNPKTTGAQITEIILKEPSLGTRVLSLVNSSFYRRRKPIMTVSQAVVQIGMKPLSELCAGLILLQKFVPTARQSGPFANCLKRTVVTSLLTSTINGKANSSLSSKTEETGYLAGSFAELGTLLLAFYFPQVYETALKRSESKKHDISQSIKEITGLSPLQISMEVLQELNLPEFYSTVLDVTDKVTRNIPIAESDQVPEQIISLGKSLSAAKCISSAIISGSGKPELDKAIQFAINSLNLPSDLITAVIGDLPAQFKDHCSAIEINLPTLPTFIHSYKNGGEPTKDQDEQETSGFMDFVDEIRQAVDNREPPASVITSVLETFVWSLKFDRVMLLLLDKNKTKLVGRMGLGEFGDLNPQNIIRPIENAPPLAPDAAANREARPVFNGDPITPGSWPIVAIPVGFGKKAIGVVYGECNEGSRGELSAKEQAAIGVLTELLDRSIVVKG
ncbi:MAG: HDOD domain-containing protein [Bdellovibrionales bacterium]|nr:HDOD domain-containing protein [Bdellovibrionales bacterium]